MPEVLQAERVDHPTKITGEDIAIIVVGSTGTMLLILVGGAVAGNAMLISLLTTGSSAILWMKLPGRLRDIPGMRHGLAILPLSEETRERLLASNWKEWLMDHEILMDILATGAIFAVFGTTLTGLMAAGLTDLTISVLMRCRRLWKSTQGNLAAWKSQVAFTS
jgi:hypothetical protein